ncbi:GTP-binding protein [uncultured Sunxiuqinia sp.]|uniref:CobW family GTP-binding protein n=1 Tax=uncultured Sunxiuqinia sp. TaxID=1573825 RepID=UPI002AA8DB74|nr:GTP-binding protein [uncultured Sunxiuqinia sp.]
MSIPLHLITGFLGSGKTSFLDHFLKKTGTKESIAIIQNEFSPVNIDGRKFYEDANFQVLEINNGSVFCVCLLGSFIQSLNEFVEKYKPDLLLMEASGLSDPIGVGQIFQSSQLKGKVYLEHVWCLVDSFNFNRIPALKVRMDHQLRSADTIILNKTDLLKGSTDDLLTKIKAINPFAKIVEGKYGQVDIIDYKRALNLFPEDQASALGRPDIGSVVIRSTRSIAPENLTQFLNQLKADCLRCKGFVKLKTGKSAFVQGVLDSVTIHEVDNFSGAGDLVLIGNFEDEKNLQLMFDEFCKDEH